MLLCVVCVLCVYVSPCLLILFVGGRHDPFRGETGSKKVRWSFALCINICLYLLVIATDHIMMCWRGPRAVVVCFCHANVCVRRWEIRTIGMRIGKVTPVVVICVFNSNVSVCGWERLPMSW